MRRKASTFLDLLNSFVTEYLPNAVGDRHLKEWSEQWFSIPSNDGHSMVSNNEVPDFLR